jgi:hypothetical protein
MFLELEIPDDDPLRPAKLVVNDAAPGFRIYDKGSGGVGWESDYIWLVSVNEEDGLDFKLRQTVDGETEIQALWKEHELDSTAKLRDLLRQDAQWDVYQLRAVVLVQNRIEAQLDTLQESGETPRDASVIEGPWKLAERLRSLESDMLLRARVELQDQVSVEGKSKSTDDCGHDGYMVTSVHLLIMCRKRASSNLKQYKATWDLERATTKKWTLVEGSNEVPTWR